jgi:hypothetical protein
MLMNEIDSIIVKISELASKHKETGDGIDDLEMSWFLELEAFSYISEYCEQQGFMVDGFPHDKRRLAEEEADFDEDYFCQERFLLYVDTLSLENETVANLNWHYVNSFWPGEFKDKLDFLESIKGRIESEVFYDVKF